MQVQIGREGAVYRVEDGQLVPHKKSGKLTKAGKEAMEIQRIRGMVAVNEAGREALRLNIEHGTEAELAQAQAQLQQVYAEFVAQHGPLTARANQRALADDPNLPFLLSLEDDYDSQTNTAQPGPIFQKRIITVHQRVESADNPTDALRIALSETGELNWVRMAALTGQTPAQLQQALRAAGLVFQTPAGEWVTAEEYLSGNVRQKLKDAEAAAALNPALAPNVDALQAVVPADLAAEDIKAGLGSG
ncbi:MAG: hypothetical protein GY805_29205, partial [Chloroflexi bacterium]|nr:hypothetical protein [Chloroflexota bacterium]